MSRSRRPGRRSSKPRRERKVDLERYRGIIEDWAAFTEAAARPEPSVFRIRSGRIAEEELLERLRVQGFVTRSLEGLPGFHQVEQGDRPISQTIEHWLGLLYVQQASTGVAAPEVGVVPGARVLDLCSAPGGKTTHMADLMGDRGCIVASEISEPRIRGLLGNIYRLGHPNILVVAGDGRTFPEGALFDHVLVDAPCSGEGTLRRRGGSAPHQSASFQSYVTGAQKALLEKAIRVVRPGGTVLYVTCTFSPEENEAVVSDALGRLPVELERLHLPVPHARGVTAFGDQRYDPRLEGAARIYPHHLDSGGLFLARLRRLPDGSGAAAEVAEGAPSGEDQRAGGATAGGSGWGPVPDRFPDNATAVNAESETPSHSASTGEGRGAKGEAIDIAGGVDEVRERFQMADVMADIRWTARGGRVWMHSLDEWPLAAWVPGDWRGISVGVRAIDFDSRGRARPTNDFLRLAGSGVEGRYIDVDARELRRLLEREAIEVAEEDRGPIAIRSGGTIYGRGAVTVDGLKSEIAKARAADLLRVLGA